MTHEIRFGLTIDQDRFAWPELLAHVRLAEELGFDYVWIYDHFVGPQRQDGNSKRAQYEPAPEAWTLLAGLAASTSRIRLGTKVSSATFRHPALLAKEATTVDLISGGRTILGLGAGWHEAEHRMYGLPFPAPRERVDRFTETVEIVDRLMRDDRTTFHGRYYQLEDAPFEPKPIQRPRIPLLIGTQGRRMMRIVARFADIWDLGVPHDETVDRIQLLRQRCHEIGRDPSSIRISIEGETRHTEAEAAFRSFVTHHRDMGLTDFFLEVPRSDPADTLRHLARSVLPELRQTRQVGGNRAP